MPSVEDIRVFSAICQQINQKHGRVSASVKRDIEANSWHFSTTKPREGPTPATGVTTRQWTGATAARADRTGAPSPPSQPRRQQSGANATAVAATASLGPIRWDRACNSVEVYQDTPRCRVSPLKK